MINISALLDEIKASPYREIVISTPHTGKVTFAGIKQGDKVVGPQDQLPAIQEVIMRVQTEWTEKD